MPTHATTQLTCASRTPEGSRATRRLRRTGEVPGIVYGGDQTPVPIQVNERTLRRTLLDAGAVLELQIDDAAGGPVVVKELVRHPVTGATMHLDLLRVRMDVAIQSTTVLELTGAETAPGVVEGGVLEHMTRELTIEALPGEIPESIAHDVSEMQIGDTLTVEQLSAPSGVTLLDDPETVVASLTPPRLQTESEDTIEEETAVVGEAEAEGATGDDAESAADTDAE